MSGPVNLTDVEWSVLAQCAAPDVLVHVENHPAIGPRERAAVKLAAEGLLYQDKDGVYWATDVGRWALTKRGA